jgi:hypothetical protein
MELALPKESRTKYLNDSILHLTIHDAVLHAKNAWMIVSCLFIILNLRSY